MEVVSNLATTVVPSPADNTGLVSAASSGLRAAKKDDKILCYRCDNSGHKADVWTAVLCLYYERL
jgi:hypothetical protein